jgi:hypothetical protein
MLGGASVDQSLFKEDGSKPFDLVGDDGTAEVTAPPLPSPLPTDRRPSSPKATRFTAIVSEFEDDFKSKLGDWACGYTSLLLALGYVAPAPAAADAPAAAADGNLEASSAPMAPISLAAPGLAVDRSVNGGVRHLDVGCGKGALCAVLHTRLGVGRVAGVRPPHTLYAKR